MLHMHSVAALLTISCSSNIRLSIKGNPFSFIICRLKSHTRDHWLKFHRSTSCSCLFWRGFYFWIMLVLFEENLQSRIGIVQLLHQWYGSGKNCILPLKIHLLTRKERNVQLCQLTFSDQSSKHTRQDRMVVWVFTGILYTGLEEMFKFVFLKEKNLFFPPKSLFLKLFFRCRVALSFKIFS